MRKGLLGIVLAFSILAADQVVLEGPFGFYEAQKACQKVGQGYRAMEIYELFALRGEPATFERESAFWSGTSLHTTRKDPTKKIDEEFHVEELKLPAFTYYYKDGDVTVSPKSKEAKVLCTNAAKKHKRFDQFEKTVNDTVADHNLEIEWEPLTEENKKKRFNYQNAVDYCEAKEDLGGGWRLPMLDEMYAIINYDYSDPATDRALFGIMMFKYYWVEDELNDHQAYVVGMKVGSVATSDKLNESYVRCVRELD